MYLQHSGDLGWWGLVFGMYTQFHLFWIFYGRLMQVLYIFNQLSLNTSLCSCFIFINNFWRVWEESEKWIWMKAGDTWRPYLLLNWACYDPLIHTGLNIWWEFVFALRWGERMFKEVPKLHFEDWALQLLFIRTLRPSDQTLRDFMIGYCFWFCSTGGSFWF